MNPLAYVFIAQCVLLVYLLWYIWKITWGKKK